MGHFGFLTERRHAERTGQRVNRSDQAGTDGLVAFSRQGFDKGFQFG